MKKIIILSIFALCFTCYMQAQSYKIIVNNSNSTATLSATEVSNFFLKKKTKWESGQKVIPVDLSGSSAVRKEFSKQVVKKSVGSVKSYWQQYVFAGKGTPPVEKKDDAEMISFIKRTSGAIGYVSASADISGVKVVKIVN